MPLGNRQSKPTIWVQFNARDAKLLTTEVNGAGEKEKKSHDELVATLKDLRIKEDTYDNAPADKLVASFDDGDNRIVVQFSVRSRAAQEFLGRMNAADVSEPVLLRPYKVDAEDRGQTQGGEAFEKDLVGSSIRQGPTFETLVAPFYGAEFGAKLPAAINLKDDAGKDILVKGKPMVDGEATDMVRGTMVMGLIAAINARIKGDTQADTHTGGVDTDEALAAGGEQAHMRARGG